MLFHTANNVRSRRPYRFRDARPQPRDLGLVTGVRSELSDLPMSFTSLKSWRIARWSASAAGRQKLRRRQQRHRRGVWRWANFAAGLFGASVASAWRVGYVGE